MSGEGVFVDDNRMETAEIYKVSKLRIQKHGQKKSQEPPPWHNIAPELPVYRQRGHRRLDTRTHTTKCSTCVWGCRMSVEMTIDHWHPSQKRYREETFCYGPLSCSFYKAGQTRKVPGRKGMSWEEADWVDEQDVSHRGPDV